MPLLITAYCRCQRDYCTHELLVHRREGSQVTEAFGRVMLALWHLPRCSVGYSSDQRGDCWFLFTRFSLFLATVTSLSQWLYSSWFSINPSYFSSSHWLHFTSAREEEQDLILIPLGLIRWIHLLLLLLLPLFCSGIRSYMGSLHALSLHMHASKCTTFLTICLIVRLYFSRAVRSQSCLLLSFFQLLFFPGVIFVTLI